MMTEPIRNRGYKVFRAPPKGRPNTFEPLRGDQAFTLKERKHLEVLYHLILSSAGPDFEAFGQNRFFQGKLGVSAKTIQRRLKKLQYLDLISMTYLNTFKYADASGRRHLKGLRNVYPLANYPRKGLADLLFYAAGHKQSLKKALDDPKFEPTVIDLAIKAKNKEIVSLTNVPPPPTEYRPPAKYVPLRTLRRTKAKKAAPNGGREASERTSSAAVTPSDNPIETPVTDPDAVLEASLIARLAEIRRRKAQPSPVDVASTKPQQRQLPPAAAPAPPSRPFSLFTPYPAENNRRAHYDKKYEYLSNVYDQRDRDIPGPVRRWFKLREERKIHRPASVAAGVDLTYGFDGPATPHTAAEWAAMKLECQRLEQERIRNEIAAEKPGRYAAQVRTIGLWVPANGIPN